MLELIKAKNATPVTLLDFGCGTSHLYEYILKQEIADIEYSGLDISEKFIRLSQEKFPTIRYFCEDILAEKTNLPNFDYIVLNGVMTEKRELSFDEMFDYFKKLTLKLFDKANIGLAVNLMSKHVDWERADLFHLPFDTLAHFSKK